MRLFNRLQVSAAAILLTLALPATLPADIIFTASLNGPSEAPPTVSAATGSATVTLAGDSLTVMESFTGLSAPASAGHIHCCSMPGVSSPVALPFTGFPSMTAATYTNTFDLTLASTYSSAFLTSSGGTAADAEAALIANLNAGLTYVNIHTSNFPAGEIRGQLTATPEPYTAGLLLLALLPLGWRARHGSIQSPGAPR